MRDRQGQGLRLVKADVNTTLTFWEYLRLVAALTRCCCRTRKRRSRRRRRRRKKKKRRRRSVRTELPELRLN